MIDYLEIVIKIKNYLPLTEEEKAEGRRLGIYRQGNKMFRDLGENGSVMLADIERNDFNEKALERLLK